MRLYYSPTSPYVRKVMVLLHEAGKLDEVELITASGTPLEPAAGLNAANPLTKVPALDRDDGPTIYDSRVVCAYLDDHFGSGFYPAGARRWDTLTLEATGDGITDAALLMTYEARLRPEDKRFPEWVEGQWSKIARACSAVNERWMSHLSGPLDMGQIALACGLAYVDFRHGARNWREGNDALAAWFETFSARPSMAATVPPQ